MYLRKEPNQPHARTSFALLPSATTRTAEPPPLHSTSKGGTAQCLWRHHERTLVSASALSADPRPPDNCRAGSAQAREIPEINKQAPHYGRPASRMTTNAPLLYTEHSGHLHAANNTDTNAAHKPRTHAPPREEPLLPVNPMPFSTLRLALQSHRNTFALS